MHRNKLAVVIADDQVQKDVGKGTWIQLYACKISLGMSP